MSRRRNRAMNRARGKMRAHKRGGAMQIPRKSHKRGY